MPARQHGASRASQSDGSVAGVPLSYELAPMAIRAKSGVCRQKVAQAVRVIRRQIVRLQYMTRSFRKNRSRAVHRAEKPLNKTGGACNLRSEQVTRVGCGLALPKAISHAIFTIVRASPPFGLALVPLARLEEVRPGERGPYQRPVLRGVPASRRWHEEAGLTVKRQTGPPLVKEIRPSHKCRSRTPLSGSSPAPRPASAGTAGPAASPAWLPRRCHRARSAQG